MNEGDGEMAIDTFDYNRRVWDRFVAQENEWTVPVSQDQVARAGTGDWTVVLTPVKPVPREWFGDLGGARVLGLASGGGQQGPILAAAGATVTILDNSPAQLAQDRMVAERDSLPIKTEQGVMTDLSRFSDESFDLIFHPVSNIFSPEILPMWQECFRVLKPGGALLAGFNNPVAYIFDEAAEDAGELVVRHKLPYSDLTSLNQEELDRVLASGRPLEFCHTLEDQIGGQIAAGFHIVGFFEDGYPGRLLDAHTPLFIATRALKP